MININNRDPRPIYEQIADSLRKMIISGVYAQDEKLPSVRELSQQMAINPNTIQRAYRELELSGFSYSVPGKGNFAWCSEDNARKSELMKKLSETASELRFLGVSEQELISCITGKGEEK